MSLYNLINGYEPCAGPVLTTLNIHPNSIPRFRDAYFAWSDESKTTPVCVIMTRTGGGNRPYYDSPESRAEVMEPDEAAEYEGPFNQSLREHSNYISDKDDDFDCTFALFQFSVPQEHLEPVINYLNKYGNPKSLEEKTNEAVSALGSTIRPR